MIWASSRTPDRTRVEAIQADERRRRVDRIHDVVERARELVNVLAVERRDERAIQPLDDVVRQRIALVLDVLDVVGVRPDGPLGRDHRFEQPRPVLQLDRERLEIGEELFFARYQAEGHESPGELVRKAKAGGL